MTSDDLARIHRAAFVTPRPWSAAEIGDLLQSPGVFLDLSPTGFAMGRVVLDEAELLTIAVDPAHQGRGTGRMLLGRFLDHAQAKGAARAFLEVAETNHAARHLYETAGFTVTGKRPRYFHTPQGDRVDAILMAHALGATA